ncbi:MAG: nicotinate (nicotinamide) nucleotide adenylyltransferase [Chlamydiota bacterium]
MTKTIGFFGGSFDPIHFGHIGLALQLMEIHKLDEVLFCPVQCSPFKLNSPPMASPSHRLQMLKIVLEEIPKFRLLSSEIDREGPSYTVDTLRELHRTTPRLRLLLSEESALHFEKWKNPEELIRLAPPLIGTRPGTELTGPFSEILKKGLTRTKAFETSSSEIRERLNKKLYCGHLIPGKALDYIHAHRLYSP